MISVKSANLVSVIIEGTLYGFSALMFFMTIWALVYKRTAKQLNYLMFGIACVLFTLSTLHIIADARHVYRGFIVANGTDTYFLNGRENTFKNSVYELETLVADAVLIYRCYIVWQNLWVLIVPVLLWIGTAIAATHTVWSISQPIVQGDTIFLLEVGRWALSFYALALATNVIATGLLAYKIWHVNRAVARIRSSSTATTHSYSDGNSSLQSLLLLILECGALYSFTLIVMISVYTAKSNSAYLVIDLIGQIIPITFYVIIIRATVARMTDQQKQVMLNKSINPNASIKFQINRFTKTETFTFAGSSLQAGSRH
ncbi:hypothetical protein AX17_002924 [Amanita inopinata Kibby_2008]|nr:hypothetical protein AX17_002924 [Amanita inopinata Kibby_2008]